MKFRTLEYLGVEQHMSLRQLWVTRRVSREWKAWVSRMITRRESVLLVAAASPRKSKLQYELESRRVVGLDLQTMKWQEQSPINCTAVERVAAVEHVFVFWSPSPLNSRGAFCASTGQGPGQPTNFPDVIDGTDAGFPEVCAVDGGALAAFTSFALTETDKCRPPVLLKMRLMDLSWQSVVEPPKSSWSKFPPANSLVSLNGGAVFAAFLLDYMDDDDVDPAPRFYVYRGDEWREVEGQPHEDWYACDDYELKGFGGSPGVKWCGLGSNSVMVFARDTSVRPFRWDLDTGVCEPLARPHSARPTACFSFGLDVLLVGDGNKSLELYDADTGRWFALPHQPPADFGNIASLVAWRR